MFCIAFTIAMDNGIPIEDSAEWPQSRQRRQWMKNIRRAQTVPCNVGITDGSTAISTVSYGYSFLPGRVAGQGALLSDCIAVSVHCCQFAARGRGIAFVHNMDYNPQYDSCSHAAETTVNHRASHNV